MDEGQITWEITELVHSNNSTQRGHLIGRALTFLSKILIVNWPAIILISERCFKKPRSGSARSFGFISSPPEKAVGLTKVSGVPRRHAAPRRSHDETGHFKD